MNNPEGSTESIDALRKFRAKMLAFQQAVGRVRSFYDGDTDTDILMRLVENLKDEVTTVQDDQDLLLENLTKVAKFIEKLDERAN